MAKVGPGARLASVSKVCRCHGVKAAAPSTVSSREGRRRPRYPLLVVPLQISRVSELARRRELLDAEEERENEAEHADDHVPATTARVSARARAVRARRFPAARHETHAMPRNGFLPPTDDSVVMTSAFSPS